MRIASSQSRANSGRILRRGGMAERSMVVIVEDAMKKLNRREFVQTTTAVGVAAAAPLLQGPASQSEPGRAPTMVTPKSVKPVVVASSNGNRFKNGGTKTCIETAFAMITGGSDVLDALIAGVNIVELDPLDDSVGYGGLPNAEGVVQL